MSINQLRFTGSDSAACVLGGPLVVHYGDVHIGTWAPVTVSRGGTEILIDNFTPSSGADLQRLRKLRIGWVVLPELVAFIAEHFANVTLIRLVLSHNIEIYRDGMKLAAERSALLQRMGASHIVITPKPDPGRVGHFVVAAVWEYNQANLAALAATREAEHAAYREREAEAARPRWRKTSCLRRLFRHRPPGGEARDSRR